MSREAILNRLRRVASSDRSEPYPKVLPEFPECEDCLATFRLLAEKAGAVVLDGTADEALDVAMRQIVGEAAAEEVCWERSDIFERHRIPSELTKEADAPDTQQVVISKHARGHFQLPVLGELRSLSRLDISQLRVSVGSAEMGIAETGTVVEVCGGKGSRILSVLPPVHVVFLSPADILMNHMEFFGSVKLGLQESTRLLVTGPSRTADIEKILIIGVHGPKRLYIVLR